MNKYLYMLSMKFNSAFFDCYLSNSFPYANVISLLMLWGFFVVVLFSPLPNLLQSHDIFGYTSLLDIAYNTYVGVHVFLHIYAH